MFSITINKSCLSSEEIEKGNFSHLKNEKKVLQFCRDWLYGKQEFMFQSSGSTGKPKSIKITRKQMEASVLQTALFFGLQTNDSALVCLNTNYIGGKMMLVRGIELGLKLHLVEPSSNPLAGFEPTTQFDFIALVPLQLHHILKSEESKQILDRSKAIIIGGAAMNENLISETQKIKAPIFSTYAMTETVSHIALKRVNGKTKSDYFELLPNIKIATDNRDCLCIQGAVTNNKKLITNDLVKIINKNQFQLLGRIDNIINSGGVKVQSEKVTEATDLVFNLLDIENQFVIIGFPDELLGEKVALVLESKNPLPDYLERGFMGFLKSKLDKYEFPKTVLYLDEFPKLASGKIDKLKISIMLND